MDEPYLQIYKDMATEYGLDWRLLLEQGWRESRWDPLAIGGAGEYGLMQIHPATWNQWAAKLDLFDPFDPASNIRLAAAYWVWLRQQLQTRKRLEDYWLLAAYNWGINHVLRLLDAAGTWDDVPPRVQNYAYDIILAAEARATTEAAG
ncbi:MAG: transglycosylase SLT domain-containing protein [Chloroflexi bacterium]|nr:transglycosylase SLT domain-containing protein [Chloroflexota bacterium]